MSRTHSPVGAARHPMILILHSEPEMTDDDRAALNLLKSAVPEDQLLVVRRHDPDDDIMPRLLVSTSFFRGLEDIKIFVDDLRFQKSPTGYATRISHSA